MDILDIDRSDVASSPQGTGDAELSRRPVRQQGRSVDCVVAGVDARVRTVARMLLAKEARLGQLFLRGLGLPVLTMRQHHGAKGRSDQQR